jgi:hypothetical protein
MSEALEKRPLPPDFPIAEPLPKGVNIRRAMAGIHILNGEGSQYRCLLMAGFSRSTARALGRNGLSAEHCIAEAAKLDGMANPAKMLEAGRARAMLAIQACDPVKVPLKDTMKMLDTVEKYYGGHQIPVSDALLGLGDRLAQIVALLRLGQSRGLPVPVIDAEIVSEPVATSAEITTRRDSVNERTPDGTTR